MDESTRRQVWRRNADLEAWLAEMAELLGPAERTVNERDADAEALPVVLVIGAPRSGTTLLTQWLAATGLCAYPTNVLGRFFAAPAIGARIQRMLFDPKFAFRDEFADLAPNAPGFRSDLGKTSGALAPNEFWYFWRRFLPTTEIEALGPERLAEVDFEGLGAELRSITRAFERPFAAKGMMLQYELDTFAERIPSLVFLHVERDLEGNARSLLDARRNFFGDTAKWYSAKPPGWQELSALEPEAQVRGQVERTNEVLGAAGARAGADHYLHVGYADFCADPAALFNRLRDLLSRRAPGVTAALPTDYTGPASFAATRTGPPRT